MGEQRAKKVNEKEVLEEAEKQLSKLKEAKAKSTKEVKTEGKKEKPVQKAKKEDTKKKPKIRSKKYLKTIGEFDKSKKYALAEAIEWVKKTSYSKFPGSVEIHINLVRKKSRNPMRKMIELPHGTGKKLNIVVLDDKKIDEIAKTKKVDFDLAIASPAQMPKIAKIAKILGPKGKMPNPKSGTITTDPEKTIKELSSGKIELKEDKDAIIHQLVGKANWDDKKLFENIQKILTEIPRSQLLGVIISATMGAGVKVKL